MVPSTLFKETPYSRHDFGFSTRETPTGPTGGWSSIIGIVVAIVGNVLISVALNVQRYAHIRLSREREQRDEEQKHEQGRNGRNRGYGTDTQIGGRFVRRRSLSGDDKTGKQRRDSQPPDEDEPLLRDVDRATPTRPSDDEESIAEGSPYGSKDKSYLSSPWWWLGITLMIVGESGNFLAYGFAPASVVSPLGVVALISNCLIAPWMLHERFRKRDALGVLIAVGGCVVVVLSASGDNPKLDADKIWGLISTWEFETYLGVTLGLIVALMFASNKYGGKSILIDLGLVGLFGGYTALSTKGVASLFSNTIWRVVTFPLTYLLLSVLICTAVMQIKYVNRALQRFDSTQVIPTQFVMFTLSVIVGSAVLYQDFKRRSPEEAVKFFSGCALTFLGVYSITSGRGQDQDDHDEGSSGSDAGDIRLRIEDEDMIDAPYVATSRRRQSMSAVERSRLPADLRLDTGVDEPQTQGLLEALVNSPVTASRAPNLSAAVHHTPSRLARRSSNSRQQPPPLHATTSEPAVPTSALSEPSPDTSRHHSVAPWRQGGHDRPKTPENPPLAAESGGLTPARFGSIGRHSLADILPHPSPFTNPLSNSLTAIVADSLRRGVDIGGSVRRRSMRRKRSRNMDDRSGFARSLGDTTLESSMMQHHHHHHQARHLAPAFVPVARPVSHDTAQLQHARGIVRKPSDLVGRQPSVTEEEEEEEGEAGDEDEAGEQDEG